MRGKVVGAPLRALLAAAGLLLLATALFLVAPQVTGLTLPVDAPHILPLALALAANGFALLEGARALTRHAAGTLEPGLLDTAPFLNLTLGYWSFGYGLLLAMAAFGLRTDLLWLAGLALPIAVNVLATKALSKSGASDEEDEEDTEELSPEEIKIQPDFCRPPTQWPRIRGEVLLFGLILVAFLLVFVVGLLLLLAAHQTLLKGEAWNPIASDRTFFIAPLAMGGIYIVLALFGWITSARSALRGRLTLRTRPDVGRELSVSEIQYLKTSLIEAVRYRRAIKVPKYYSMLSSIYCIALVLAVCASSLLVAFYPLFLNEQSWPFRQTMLGENGYSICVGLIGMVLLCIAITDILQRCSRRLRDWGNAGRGTYPILMALAHAVRFRQLKPGDPFEPAAFFRDLAFKGRPLLFGTTGLSLVAAGVLFAHDTADVTTFADDGITYTQYWSGEKTRIGYADIAHAETQCNFFKKNGGVEVRYVIVAKNGLIFELAKNASIRKTLDSIEHIDRHLVSAGVPFEHEPLRPGIGVPRPPFDPDCLDGLDERFGSDRAVRIRALLHMD